MRRKQSKDIVMQEDNASWHKAKLVTSYLDRQKVKRLRWPPQSPDLSPIENLWKQIKIITGKKRHRIRNIKEMEDALSELWPILGGERL
jgi:transposase